MTCVGIDVGKERLDTALRSGSGKVKAQRYENTPDGHEALAERLCEADGIERIVLEATGGYERPVAAALAAAGLPARCGGEPASGPPRLRKSDWTLG